MFPFKLLATVLATVFWLSAVTASPLSAADPRRGVDAGDQEAKRVDSPPVLLQMIRDEAIHRELDLDDAQREAILATLREIDPDWFRVFSSPPEEQRPVLARLNKRLQSVLRKHLDRDQIDRVLQLRRQALGTRMVLLKETATKLNFTARQLDEANERFLRTDAKIKGLNRQQLDGNLSPEEVITQSAEARDAERKAIMRILTSQQRGKLGSLTGEPFDFATIKRTLPMVPELEFDGASWLQGEPTKLSELRGKVVAVHFYAFQCINCIRNLPHYAAWHDDYADEGLVVIGIQSPETSAESKPELVRAAMEKEGIEYPVLFDGEMSNWKSWKNGVWPTVYLIDKEGFLRRWWQGEMNWKGTPGEEQMRATVESLLNE